MKYVKNLIRRHKKAAKVTPQDSQIAQEIQTLLKEQEIAEPQPEVKLLETEVSETASQSSSLNVELNEEMHLLHNKIAELEDNLKRIEERNNRLHRSLLIHSDNTSFNFDVGRKIIMLFCTTLIVNQIVMIYTLKNI